MVCKTAVVSQVMSNINPHAYQTVFSYRNALLNNAAAANKTASADRDIAVENCASRNVAVVFYCCVMFKQCTSIDDTVVAHPCPGIDDCLWPGIEEL